MDASFAELRNRIAGEVVVPTSQAYEGLRNIFNQEGRPAVIVRGHTNDDIVTALRFARKCPLPLSVRSGGHDWNGTATNTGGLVLDLTHSIRWSFLIQKSDRCVSEQAPTGERSHVHWQITALPFHLAIPTRLEWAV